MNNKENAIRQIEAFLQSDEKCMLLTGTNQYEKHKLVMRVLNNQLENHLLLFRTNAMQNISNNEHLGWAGVKRNPKAGERIRIRKNTYECDSLNSSNTWYKTNRKFSCALVYPIDPLCRDDKMDAIDDLFDHKDISKIFLITWTDRREYGYSLFDKYVDRRVAYDAEEEDPAYHKRVLDIVDEIDGRRN